MPLSTTSRRDFRAFYRDHYGFVWASVRRFGVPAALVDDAAQDTFVVAYRRRAELRGPSARPWLYGIARGVASNYRRTARRVDRKRKALAQVAVRPAARPPEASALLHDLDGFLRELSARDRELFVLSEVEGFTGPELADALGCKTSTAYGRVRTLRQRLAARVDEVAAVEAEQRARPRASNNGWAALVVAIDAKPGWWGLGPSGTTVAAGGLGASAAAIVIAGVVVFSGAGRGEARDAASEPEARVSVHAAQAPTPAEAPTEAAPPSTTADAAPQAPTPTSVAPQPQRPTPLAAARAAAARAKAPAPTPGRTPPPDTADALARENALLAEATRALGRGSPAEALAATTQHAREFPDSRLLDLRTALRVEALCAQGKGPQARAEATLFVDGHDTALRSRILGACPMDSLPRRTPRSLMTFLYSRRLRSLAGFASALALGGCIVDADLGNTETEGSSTGGPATSTTAEPPGDSTTEDPSGATTDPTVGEESGDTSTTDGPPPEFACPPMPFEEQCSLYAQDCPDGFRCMPWATAGGFDFDATVCVPLAAEPAGHNEPCQIDEDSCSDNCPVGDYCLPPTEFGGGLCLGLCDPNSDGLACATGSTCDTCAKCAFGTCNPSCDPLAPDCPAEAPTCFLDPPGDGFQCLPIPAGEEPLGGFCDNLNRCESGLICASSLELDGCESAFGCCTELCDLDDGDPGCANPAHACIPLFFNQSVPPEQEHVGYCALPENDPCLVPGNCAPAGIDETTPWCSLANEAGCDEGGAAGFFNGLACEQTCLCDQSCMGAGSCPTPATGTATGECMELAGMGSPATCIYSCAAGEICPDGMTCSDQLNGEPICVWVSPLPPEEC